MSRRRRGLTYVRDLGTWQLHEVSIADLGPRADPERLVGKRVRLLRTIRTFGGLTFRRGRLMDVIDVADGGGRFRLRAIRSNWRPGSFGHRQTAGGVERSAFEVIS